MDVQANEVVVLSSCNNQSKTGESWLSHVKLDWFYKPENIRTHSHVSVAKKDMYTSVHTTVGLKNFTLRNCTTILFCYFNYQILFD